MYARIGSPAPMQLKRSIEDLRECRFDMVLHGTATKLALPTVKISAVVGACAFPSHQG
jgi:hypothetical protein